VPEGIELLSSGSKSKWIPLPQALKNVKKIKNFWNLILLNC